MHDSNRKKVSAKIDVLEKQLTSLDHYLPQTYEYLMAELDEQRRVLAELEVLDQFRKIDAGGHASRSLPSRG